MSMGILATIKQSAISWMVFSCTVLTCWIAYAAWTNVPDAVSGQPLTKDAWNALVAKVNDIGVKTYSMYEWGGSAPGANLSNMVWHDETITVQNSAAWWTATNYSGSWILTMVNAYAGGYASTSILRITIDWVVWREYTWATVNQDANPLKWGLLDDDADNNIWGVHIVPYKKFNTSLKVEIYNASSIHESSLRVNYFTAN